jgi:prepilin peptidase CpaA
MGATTIILALHCVTIVLLLAAVVTDLRSRTIEHWVTVPIAVMAPILWWAAAMPVWPDMVIQLGMALAVFFFFAFMFKLGAMGGGDVKLLGALALWFPALLLFRMIAIMSLAGGVLTLVMWIVHKARKLPGKPEVPYGLAIVFGALWVIYERYLNHFG